MLLELAIGDAYGAGFEYADELLPYNDLSKYVQHPRHHGTKPGMYTDDTQMSIAIAELIVSGEAWTPINLADRFVSCFKRDEREGYAGRFYDFLKRVPDGQTFLRDIRPESDKSGAAMRAGPIGVYPTVDEVLEKCRVQAMLTHNTPDGIAAAQVSALMTHYFLYDLGSKSNLGSWLDDNVESQQRWSDVYIGKVKAKGWMSVRAAITAVMRNNSLSGLLRDCIAFTGDVDTVATIAMAAAAHSREYEQDLPTYLVEMLENGPYGRDYLMQLNVQLLALVQ